MIAYTIEAAKASGVFDRLMLSTDDEAIAAVAKSFGCEVPFMRPKTDSLAGDKATHLEVISHAVQALKDQDGYWPDYIMILQPTSPLRQSFHIKEAADLIIKSGADSVLSVAEVPENFNPHKAMLVTASGELTLFNGSPVRKRVARRQDLPKVYWSVGSMYLFKTDLISHPEEPNFYGDKVMPYVIDAS